MATEDLYEPSSLDGGLISFLQWVNVELAGELFGVLITIGIFAVAFLYIRGRPVEVGAAAALITAVSSYFLFVLELVPIEIVYLYGLLLAATGFALFATKR